MFIANSTRKHPGRAARGFTLIELLIVLMIIGLLGALVGPKVLSHVGTSKTKAAKAQIEMTGSALDAFRLDFGRYPTTDEGLKMLWDKPDDEAKAGQWKGPYLKKKADKDPWGKEWIYKAPGTHGDYDLSSYGSDGKEGGSGEEADVNSWE